MNEKISIITVRKNNIIYVEFFTKSPSSRFSSTYVTVPSMLKKEISRSEYQHVKGYGTNRLEEKNGKKKLTMQNP